MLNHVAALHPLAQSAGHAGLTLGGGRRPDTVLPLLDFVAIHMYPITNYRQWDWKQEGVPAGPDRAEAMMNAAKYCSLGSMSHALYDVGGEYRRNM